MCECVKLRACQYFCLLMDPRSRVFHHRLINTESLLGSYLSLARPKYSTRGVIQFVLTPCTKTDLRSSSPNYHNCLWSSEKLGQGTVFFFRPAQFELT